ncbi:MAG: ABC transporter ATP-binding protein [Caulobacteraceae bacterium]
MSFVAEIQGLGVSHRAGGFGLPAAGRRVHVLIDVSLKLGDGRTLAVIGESGSGKTTLARALVGLAPITAGEVWVDGRRGRGRSDVAWRMIRRSIGMVFQDPNAALNPRMTIAELVAEPIVAQGLAEADPRREARRLLDFVGLPAAFLDRFPHQLSGGQARRVMVARALAVRPKLIIADEPTAGLDLTVQGELLNLFVSLQAELGLAYLFITHNLAVARRIADEVAGALPRPHRREGRAGRAVRPAGPSLHPRPAERAGRPRPCAPGAAGASRRAFASGRPAASSTSAAPSYADVCRQAPPPLAELAGGRQVRCHFPFVSTQTTAEAAA